MLPYAMHNVTDDAIYRTSNCRSGLNFSYDVL